MNEQWINETCLMFTKAFDGLDMTTVRNVLTLALKDCKITKTENAVVPYEGDSNEKLIESFIVTKKVNGSSDRTAKYYAYVLRKFFQKVNDIRAEDCTSTTVKVYLARRELDDKVSATTRNNERSVLCSFFQWMEEEELIQKNPMRKVKRIKTRKEQKKAFSAMELEQIRANCKDEKETAVVEILISTGCRVSELCGIKLSDIDGDSVVVHGKGNKDRTCYLTAKAQYAISEYLSSPCFSRRRVENNPFLFNGVSVTPIRAVSIERMVTRIGTEARVSKCHPHRFRRTCATMALEHGMPLETVSRMLGHESIETTQIYLDLNDRAVESAHRKYVS